MEAPTSSGHPGGLTSRELKVARLVFEGHSNRSIAARLFISERTAARHVQRVVDKLGFWIAVADRRLR